MILVQHRDGFVISKQKIKKINKTQKRRNKMTKIKGLARNARVGAVAYNVTVILGIAAAVVIPLTPML